MNWQNCHILTKFTNLFEKVFKINLFSKSDTNFKKHQNWWYSQYFVSRKFLSFTKFADLSKFPKILEFATILKLIHFFLLFFFEFSNIFEINEIFKYIKLSIISKNWQSYYILTEFPNITKLIVSLKLTCFNVTKIFICLKICQNFQTLER